MANPASAGITHADGVQTSVVGPTDTGFMWVLPSSIDASETVAVITEVIEDVNRGFNAGELAGNRNGVDLFSEAGENRLVNLPAGLPDLFVFDLYGTGPGRHTLWVASGAEPIENTLRTADNTAPHPGGIYFDGPGWLRVYKIAGQARWRTLFMDQVPDVIQASFNADHTILKADTAGSVDALAVPVSSLVGRTATGSIQGLSKIDAYNVVRPDIYVQTTVGEVVADQSPYQVANVTAPITLSESGLAATHAGKIFVLEVRGADAATNTVSLPAAWLRSADYVQVDQSVFWIVLAVDSTGTMSFMRSY